MNSDFSREEEVDAILDAWQDRKSINSSHHKGKKSIDGDNDDEQGQEGVVKVHRTPLTKEISIVFARHARLIVRDPILYVGRCAIFLFMNMIFAFVYWKARDNTQDQILNKFWIIIW